MRFFLGTSLVRKISNATLDCHVIGDLLVGKCRQNSMFDLPKKLESARSCNNEDEDHGEIKKKEAKQFAINQQFILGCHEAGLGPGDADIVYSAMNLPLAVGFWSTQGNFTAVEEKVGERKWQPLLLLWKRLVGRKYIKH